MVGGGAWWGIAGGGTLAVGGIVPTPSHSATQSPRIRKPLCRGRVKPFLLQPPTRDAAYIPCQRGGGGSPWGAPPKPGVEAGLTPPAGLSFLLPSTCLQPPPHQPAYSNNPTRGPKSLVIGVVGPMVGYRWSPRSELNRRPAGYKSAALPG